MWLYLIIFFIPVLAYFYKKKSIRGDKGLEQSVLLLAIILLTLCVLVGISDMLGGYDRYIYGEYFDEVADMRLGGDNIFNASIFQAYPKELGFDFLNVFISFFTANRYIFILILTIIIYTLTFFSFKRYMTNYPFAVILFFGLMFFFTFTYLRQILAVCISWLAIKYIIDRKIWKYSAIILLAFFFHNSAIIVFPLYFLPIRKFRIHRILIVMGICFLLGVTGFSTALFDAFGGLTNAEDRVVEYATDTSGFRFAYLVEAIFFLAYILSNYNKIPNNKNRIILLNISLVFCGILLFFIKSENGGRLSWFFMIGLISTITYISSNRRKMNNIALSMIIVCLFLYIRVYNGWQVYLNLYPYKTFLTNGYRPGDYSYENFEYDHNYDRDKLYR